MAVLGGWRRGRPAVAEGSEGARRALRLLALVAGSLPVATYLAGLVPWESTGAPVLAMAAAVVVADLLVAAVAALGPVADAPARPAAGDRGRSRWPP